MKLENFHKSITLMSEPEYSAHILALRNSRYEEKIIHKKKATKSTKSKSSTARSRSMRKMTTKELASTVSKEAREALMKELMSK